MQVMYSFSCPSWELNCEELKYTLAFYKKRRKICTVSVLTQSQAKYDVSASITSS